MAELYYHTRVWSNETSEYERHRIPGMIVTKSGTILIYNRDLITVIMNLPLLVQRGRKAGLGVTVGLAPYSELQN